MQSRHAFTNLTKLILILTLAWAVSARVHDLHNMMRQRRHVLDHECTPPAMKAYGNNWIRHDDSNVTISSGGTRVDDHNSKLHRFYYKFMNNMAGYEPSSYIARVCDSSVECDKNAKATQITADVPFLDNFDETIENMAIDVDCLCIDDSKPAHNWEVRP